MTGMLPALVRDVSLVDGASSPCRYFSPYVATSVVDIAALLSNMSRQQNIWKAVVASARLGYTWLRGYSKPSRVARMLYRDVYFTNSRQLR